MTTAAQRWSAPDEEFRSIRGARDYAVVGLRSKDVQNDINLLETQPHSEFETFGSFLDCSYDNHYYFAQTGSLVYSDDATEEKRAAMLSRSNFLKRPELNDHQKTLCCDLAKALNIPALEDGCATNRVNADAVDYIIKLKKKDDKVDALKLVSGEMGQTTPRPTMMIIHIFSDFQSVTLGEGSGYVTAYDFVKDEIIIKSYKASPDHHPLGEPWSVIPGTTLFKGSPGKLARHLIHRKGLNPADSMYGFDIVTRVFAGEWIIENRDALKKVHGNNHGDLLDRTTLDELRNTIEAHITKLDTLPFPNKTRPVDPKSNPNFTVCYRNISSIVEQVEENLRRCALKGKENGQKKAAANLAKFFDGVCKTAAALSENPDLDFDLWKA